MDEATITVTEPSDRSLLVVHCLGYTPSLHGSQHFTRITVLPGTRFTAVAEMKVRGQAWSQSKAAALKPTRTSRVLPLPVLAKKSGVGGLQFLQRTHAWRCCV